MANWAVTAVVYGENNIFSILCKAVAASLYSGDWPFESRGASTKVPPTGIEYVKVLRVSPFNFTAIGLPDASKISTRPTIVALASLTSAT